MWLEFSKKFWRKLWPGWLAMWGNFPWNAPEMASVMPAFGYGFGWGRIIPMLFMMDWLNKEPKNEEEKELKELVENVLALNLMTMLFPQQLYLRLLENLPGINEKINEILGEDDEDEDKNEEEEADFEIEVSSVYEDILGGDADVLNPWIEKRTRGVSRPDLPGSGHGAQ